MKYSLLGACAVACCCAAPVFAQGLTRVETLALQQQLRDDGCGSSHITGRVDATTRADVKKCETKYAGATDAPSMLAAMKIGFGNGTTDPTVANARSGEGGSMGIGGTSAGSMNGSSMNQGMTHRGGMMKDGMSDSTARGARHRMMRDSTMMRRGSRMMRDSTMMPRGSRMRDSARIRHDTAGTMGSGGSVDMNKSTPMTPPTSTTNPVTNPNPMMPPTPATPTNPMRALNPRDTSTTPRDTSSIHNGTKP
jgi:hypothetical protein